MDDVISKIESGDISVFDRIPPQMSDGDKKSLLAVHAAMRSQGRQFCYLEIGSHLGGSLQTFLADPMCVRIFSVDKRPKEQPPDERGRFQFRAVSTREMLDGLSRWYAEQMGKLVCFDSGTRAVERGAIDVKPDLCFVDGEHTDEATFSDFLFCLSVAGDKPVVLFHDLQIVYEGVKRCVEHLVKNGMKFNFYFLPGKMAALEVGCRDLVRSEVLFSRVVRGGTESFEMLTRLGYYRGWYSSKTGRLARAMSGAYNGLRGVLGHRRGKTG